MHTSTVSALIVTAVTVGIVYIYVCKHRPNSIIIIK